MHTNVSVCLLVGSIPVVTSCAPLPRPFFPLLDCKRCRYSIASVSCLAGEAVGIALEVQKIRTKRLELMFATMDTSPDVLGEELPADDEDSGPSSLISPDASLRGRRGEPNPSPMSRPSVDITRADLDLRKVTSVSPPSLPLSLSPSLHFPRP